MVVLVPLPKRVPVDISALFGFESTQKVPEDSRGFESDFQWRNPSLPFKIERDKSRRASHQFFDFDSGFAFSIKLLNVLALKR